MKEKILSFAFLLIGILGIGQKKPDHQPFERPKLVVGIVVDQMRFEYINRFWDRYGQGGFKRLVNEGFNCKNNHFNYIPTYTGPGHASVYTGTTPRMHGIIANNWFDRNEDEMVYCTDDATVNPVGTKQKSGKMSPSKLKTTTIGDALKLFTQQRSKVIGIALKDRASILPAGHTANAAYWFEGGKEGVWISSTYYMDKLPLWVQKFNQSRLVDKYKKTWNTMYDISTYKNSREDNNPFEGAFEGEETPTFPHKLAEIWDLNKQYSILRTTAYGGSLTTDFAIACIDGESLGNNKDTDFLAISYSNTDYVGHQFGVNSKEIEDTYLHLDKDLERLLNHLDKKVGEGNYTLFLTADHGAGYVGSYLQSLKIPAGYFETSDFRKDLADYAMRTFGVKNLIKNVYNNQVYLNDEALKDIGKSVREVEDILAQWIFTHKDIDEVYTSTVLRSSEYTKGIPYLLQQGFNHNRSGNILLVLKNDVISYSKTGSSHGSGFSYDTQVPLLFFGKGIKHGETFRRTEIPDIASTITSLLGIPQTNGNSGNPIEEVYAK